MTEGEDRLSAEMAGSTELGDGSDGCGRGKLAWEWLWGTAKSEGKSRIGGKMGACIIEKGKGWREWALA